MDETLKKYKQWINYENKYPISPLTLKKCSVTDRNVWTTYEQAVSTGLPVGFVFTKDDPFFFIDLDDCYDPETQAWSEHATMVCNMFTGCNIEVSQSGTGLHIIGTTPVVIPHSKKNGLVHTEMYTQDRYCALTGHNMSGNASTIPDANTYKWFVNSYFPRKKQTENTGVLRSGPVPEWNGPQDDKKLLQMAMSSKSARNHMGASASFADLWNGNAEVLSGIFISDRDDFDRSRADSALCAQLAFWTGKDHNRIIRLWGKSALGQRDKFKNRPDYVDDTVAGACAHCSNVYNDNRKQPQPTDLPGNVKILFPEDQVKYFIGCIYVENIIKVLMPDGMLLSCEQFKNRMGKHLFIIDPAGQKTTKNAWEAFHNSQVYDPIWVHSTCFRPDLPFGHIITTEGYKMVNTYVPFSIARQPGDYTWFLDLITRLLPDQRDRNILLSYMAAVVQYPGVKFRWAPVLQGTYGNGKSTVIKMLIRCITSEERGYQYVHTVRTTDITSDFNGWLKNKIFVVANETDIKTNKDLMSTMKDLITEEFISIQAKGQDQITAPNVANFAFCMNERDAIKKHKDDRRFCMFFTNQQCKSDLSRDGLTNQYFKNLYCWLNRNNGYAIIHELLATMVIPDEFNPATDCQQAPVTSTTHQAIIESRSVQAQHVAEAIEKGISGFKGGWISTVALNNLLSNVGCRPPGPNRIPLLLGELDYVRWGKSSRIIPEENGCRTYLYVRKDHEVVGERESLEVTNMYCVAQGYAELR